MNDKKKGYLAEKKAVEYLKKKEYKIIDQNFQTRAGEIDIIAIDKKKT